MRPPAAIPGPRPVPPAPLRFAPVDLERDGAACVAFRRDSYVASFGVAGAARFDAEHGPDGAGYLGWLAARVAEWPEGHVHLWAGAALAGQLEARPRAPRPGDALARALPTGAAPGARVGYVNLFYLSPAHRGTGLGDALDAYARALFRRWAVAAGCLTVSPTNARALAYYARRGWRDLGPRAGAPAGHPPVHAMALGRPAGGW